MVCVWGQEGRLITTSALCTTRRSCQEQHWCVSHTTEFRRLILCPSSFLSPGCVFLRKKQKKKIPHGDESSADSFLLKKKKKKVRKEKLERAWSTVWRDGSGGASLRDTTDVRVLGAALVGLHAVPAPHVFICGFKRVWRRSSVLTLTRGNINIIPSLYHPCCQFTRYSGLSRTLAVIIHLFCCCFFFTYITPDQTHFQTSFWRTNK